MISTLLWLGWAACVPADTPTSATDEPEADDTAPPTGELNPTDAMVNALRADGFEVQEGRLGVLALGDCCTWRSCLKWNPTNHYVLWYLPLSPGESSEGRELEADGMAWHWRLRADEAVVFAGPLPPTARYTSYRTYVHERYVPAFDTHLSLLASLGDSLNHTRLGHAGTGEPWGETAVVMTVADQGIEARVRTAVATAGFPDAAVNVDHIPSDLAQLGVHDEADTIRMNNRLAIIEDPAEEAAWIAQPQGRVFRLTPSVPVTDLQPVPAPTFAVPGSDRDELHLQPAADALRDAIVAAHPGHLSSVTTVNVREPEIGEDCWSGCNRDVSKSNTPTFLLPADPDAFVVIYGVNHRATGLAAYHNAIVFGVDNDDPAAWIDDRQMVGSAADYVPDHPDVDQLYAWTFARDCQGAAHCTEVPTSCPGVELDELAAIHWRATVDPQTGTHPLATEMVRDGAIAFLGNP